MFKCFLLLLLIFLCFLSLVPGCHNSNNDDDNGNNDNDDNNNVEPLEMIVATFNTTRAQNALLTFNTDDSGDVAPKRAIDGNATGLAGPDLISVSNDEIFASNFQGATVTVYNIADNGDTAPKRTLLGLVNTTKAFAAGSELFVSTLADIRVFDITADGLATPVRILSGAATTLSQIQGNFVLNNELFVCNGGANRINIFNSTDNGDVAPKRTIEGANTNLDLPFDVFVLNNEVFVSSNTNNRILVFNINDNGNIAAKRNISGANTQINSPRGLFVFNNELFLANFGGNNILVFNANDTGDVAPKRIVGGVNAGIEVPLGLALNVNVPAATSRFAAKAEYAPEGIKVSWQADQNVEVRNYNVWRQQDGGKFEKITTFDIIPNRTENETFSFVDFGAEPNNHKYAYQIEYESMGAKTLDAVVKFE